MHTIELLDAETNLCVFAAKLVQDDLFSVNVENMIINRTHDVGQVVHFLLDIADDHFPVFSVFQRPAGLKHFGHACTEAVVDTAREPDLFSAALVDFRHITFIHAVAEGNGEAVPVFQRKAGENPPRVLLLRLLVFQTVLRGEMLETPG